MAFTVTMDPNTVLIISNLALATSLLYLLLVHHRATKRGHKR